MTFKVINDPRLEIATLIWNDTWGEWNKEINLAVLLMVYLFKLEDEHNSDLKTFAVDRHLRYQLVRMEEYFELTENLQQQRI